MAETHRRRTDQNGDSIHERDTDTDFWARTGAAMERYKILWIIVIGVGAWLGNNFVQPLKQVPVLQAQMIALTARQDTATGERRELRNTLRVLGRIACLGVDRFDRVKYDIDCKDIPLPGEDR